MHAIHYSITPVNPAMHVFAISCRVARPDPAGQIVSMPAWIPGSYLIRNFSKHILSIRAYSQGRSLLLTKLDKDSWQCGPCDGELMLEYEVYAWDASVRAAQLDTTQGFFNGSSVFLRVHGQEAQRCSVEILPPRGEVDGKWRVATSLRRLTAGMHDFGLYQAGDYDELIDHPVQLGNFDLIEFEACGVLHQVAVTGRHRGDLKRLATDLRRICEHHIRFYGEPAPMTYYLFLLRVVGDGYGGLEHRTSCALIASRNALPLHGQSKVSDSYRELLGLCSHEYFHTWNVKRIKPAAFTPYNLQQENYTELLWAFEGITSYYDDLALLRSGLISEESYLELLARTVTRVLRGKGRLRQSVADSSFYAWTKFYQQDENSPNAIVSYYAKGALVAFCLDSLIKQKTDQAASLDDVMRLLWRRYGMTGVGVPETAVEEIAAEVAGESLDEFFHRSVHDAGELPLAEMLELYGIKLRLRPASSARDSGGVIGKSKAPVQDIAGRLLRVDLGVTFKADQGFPRLQVVNADGAAQRAGLSAGDLLIALDGLQTTTDNLETLLERYKPGDEIEVYAFRRDELMTFRLELQAAEASTCYLEIDTEPAPAQAKARAVWLGLGR
jgi:predicted metalloprotease with PDZ domain